MSTKIPIINMIATGEKIRKLRKDKSISVREIQNALGLTNPQAVYKWQNGKSLPKIDNLVILASMLDATIDEIIVTE